MIFSRTHPRGFFMDVSSETLIFFTSWAVLGVLGHCALTGSRVDGCRRRCAGGEGGLSQSRCDGQGKLSWRLRSATVPEESFSFLLLLFASPRVPLPRSSLPCRVPREAYCGCCRACYGRCGLLWPLLFFACGFFFWIFVEAAGIVVDCVGVALDPATPVLNSGCPVGSFGPGVDAADSSRALLCL